MLEKLIDKVGNFVYNGLKIKSIETENRRKPLKVYNMECYPYNNYFVSGDGNKPRSEYVLSHNCIFCSEPLLNNKFKAFSPKRVVDEIEGLVNNYGVTAFIIYDDVFSINTKRAKAIANEILNRGLDINYRATMRATDFVRDPELATLLKRSGCLEACIGLESGDDNVLKISDKGMTVKNNSLGVKIAQNAGLKVLTYMITGLPGCTVETELKGLEFLQEHNIAEFGWYMLAPFPSTPIWVQKDKFGLDIFIDEIIQNKWDVAQCRGDNEQLTCYIDYSKSGGLSRYQIKETWLYILSELDKLKKEQGLQSIQYSNENIGGSFS